MQAWAALEGKKGEPKKAQRLFEAAAKAEPDNAMLLNTWATYEKRRGDAAKARELYKKALDSNGSHVPSIQVRHLVLLRSFVHTWHFRSCGHRMGKPKKHCDMLLHAEVHESHGRAGLFASCKASFPLFD